MHQLQLVSHNEKETKEIARIIADMLPSKAVIGLTGGLAAGKTAFSEALFKQAGYSGRFSSPTYTIINEYDSDKGRAYHLDVYRLADASELLYTGYEECLSAGWLVVIEWAEIIEDYLPQDTIRIKIDFAEDDDCRLITISLPDRALYEILKEKLHANTCD